MHEGGPNPEVGMRCMRIEEGTLHAQGAHNEGAHGSEARLMQMVWMMAVLHGINQGTP